MSSASLCRRVDCDASHCPQMGRVAGTSFGDSVPSEDLIEDDGAECCGAYSAHFEIAERESKVAGAGGERHSDGDHVSRVAEVHPVLYPDPAGHGGYQPKQHDRQSTDDRTRDREDQRTNFGEKPNRIETVAAKTKRRVE